MPVFELQTQDGRTFEVDAPDQETALHSLEKHSGSKPSERRRPKVAAGDYGDASCFLWTSFAPSWTGGGGGGTLAGIKVAVRTATEAYRAKLEAERIDQVLVSLQPRLVAVAAFSNASTELRDH
jgi:hypothetical protein